MPRPLIFIDIDGVHTASRVSVHRSTQPATGRAGSSRSSSGLGDGRCLLARPGELVWASTGLAEANDVVAPRLGLAMLPVVDWPEDDPER